MNTLEKFEAKQFEKLQAEKQIPTFGPGDTVKVNVRVKEGTRERIQAFEGVCIARKGSGINENFTVRKISYGEGVERVFPLWSSRIDSLELVRRGSVRRAKLYYLRDRQGKSARIAERTSGHGLEDKETATEEKPKKEKAKKTETKKEGKKDDKPKKEAKAKKAPAKKKDDAKAETKKEKPKKAPAKKNAEKSEKKSDEKESKE